MKKLRAIGIDDAAFKKGDATCRIVGVISRPDTIEGIISTSIKIDGCDSTEQIIEMIEKSRFCDEIKIIFLNAITVGGLNLVDIKKLSSTLNMPVICMTRKKPTDKLGMIIKKLKNGHIPNYSSLEVGCMHAQYFGISKIDAEHFIKIFTKVGHVPEPLRLAHMIASGVFSGESRGRI